MRILGTGTKLFKTNVSGTYSFKSFPIFCLSDILLNASKMKLLFYFVFLISTSKDISKLHKQIIDLFNVLFLCLFN